MLSVRLTGGRSAAAVTTRATGRIEMRMFALGLAAGVLGALAASAYCRKIKEADAYLTQRHNRDWA